MHALYKLKAHELKGHVQYSAIGPQPNFKVLVVPNRQGFSQDFRSRGPHLFTGGGVF